MHYLLLLNSNGLRGVTVRNSCTNNVVCYFIISWGNRDVCFYFWLIREAVISWEVRFYSSCLSKEVEDVFSGS